MKFPKRILAILAVLLVRNFFSQFPQPARAASSRGALKSDRREIDAYNRDPNTTHELALMNGELMGRILAGDSHVQRTLAALGEKDEKNKKGGKGDDL
jgi:hypothetical protein